MFWDNVGLQVVKSLLVVYKFYCSMLQEKKSVYILDSDFQKSCYFVWAQPERH